MDSELLKVIEQEAHAERQRILDEAEMEAKKILAQAQAQASELKAKQQVLLETEGKMALTKAKSTANLEASARILSAKDRIVEEVFQKATEQVQSMDKAKRQKLIKSLLTEACAQFEPGMVITVSKEDLSLVQQLMKELKLDAKVEAGAGVSSGVIVSNPQGTSVVLNRVSDRMARARPALVSEISKTLWG
jgi:V/A-type H+-transporting ATPase subunit E